MRRPARLARRRARRRRARRRGARRRQRAPHPRRSTSPAWSTPPGCLVVRHPDGTERASDATACALRLRPASTFKIPSALLAAEAGLVDGPDAILRYDAAAYPRQDYWPAGWDRDQPLREAMRISAVPLFRHLATRLGAERMQAGLDALGYGNRSIAGASTASGWRAAGWRSRPSSRSRSWRGCRAGALPLSARAPGHGPRRAADRARAGDATLHWKTGTARDGDGPWTAWLVGWIDRPGGTHVFACWLEDPGDFDAVRSNRMTFCRGALDRHRLFGGRAGTVTDRPRTAPPPGAAARARSLDRDERRQLPRRAAAGQAELPRAAGRGGRAHDVGAGAGAAGGDRGQHLGEHAGVGLPHRHRAVDAGGGAQAPHHVVGALGAEHGVIAMLEGADDGLGGRPRAVGDVTGDRRRRRRLGRVVDHRGGAPGVALEAAMDGDGQGVGATRQPVRPGRALQLGGQRVAGLELRSRPDDADPPRPAAGDGDVEADEGEPTRQRRVVAEPGVGRRGADAGGLVARLHALGIVGARIAELHLVPGGLDDAGGRILVEARVQLAHGGDRGREHHRELGVVDRGPGLGDFLLVHTTGEREGGDRRHQRATGQETERKIVHDAERHGPPREYHTPRAPAGRPR
ncbi:MAG: hypothetical protein HS111_31330 [Kofleriaceae bacterium]|nr:hypothetical protein [Kofleriaceae bacterium]